jgi:transposase
MVRKQGFVSPTRAAQMLGAHAHTVREWVKAALRGGDSPIRAARKDANGYYWIPVSEVHRLKRERDSKEESVGPVGEVA